MVPLSEAPSAEASDEAVLLLPQAEEREGECARRATPLSTREKIRFFFMVSFLSRSRVGVLL